MLATFLVKDEDITKDSEIKEIEYDNLEIVEQFDIENIVCLSNEIVQDRASDTNIEELQNVDDEFDNNDESVVSNKIGQE
ncbi:1923_t:CDS:1, partial [Scutellospora calospora]